MALPHLPPLAHRPDLRANLQVSGVLHGRRIYGRLARYSMDVLPDGRAVYVAGIRTADGKYYSVAAETVKPGAAPADVLPRRGVGAALPQQASPCGARGEDASSPLRARSPRTTPLL